MCCLPEMMLEAWQNGSGDQHGSDDEEEDDDDDDDDDQMVEGKGSHGLFGGKRVENNFGLIRL